MLTHSTTTPETIDEAMTIIAAFQRALFSAAKDAYRDPVWGVLTRQGIERRMQQLDHAWVAVVADVDQMHQANETYTHEGVDLRMAAGLRAADLACGRWQRGDELVFLVPRQDAIGAAERAKANLQAHGMSATFAVVWAAGHAAIAAGQAAIDADKRAGRRGHCYCGGGYMNPAIKALWLAALRGGHTQIRNALHRQRTARGEWCALGLLCELHRLETQADIWRGPDGRGDFYYLGEPYYLPGPVWDWAGMQPNAEINIAELNRTLTFAEIADQIEAYL